MALLAKVHPFRKGLRRYRNRNKKLGRQVSSFTFGEAGLCCPSYGNIAPVAQNPK
jgi:hypothetical protein